MPKTTRKTQLERLLKQLVRAHTTAHNTIWCGEVAMQLEVLMVRVNKELEMETQMGAEQRVGS